MLVAVRNSSPRVLRSRPNGVRPFEVGNDQRRSPDDGGFDDEFKRFAGSAALNTAT